MIFDSMSVFLPQHTQMRSMVAIIMHHIWMPIHTLRNITGIFLKFLFTLVFLISNELQSQSYVLLFFFQTTTIQRRAKKLLWRQHEKGNRIEMMLVIRGWLFFCFWKVQFMMSFTSSYIYSPHSSSCCPALCAWHNLTGQVSENVLRCNFFRHKVIHAICVFVSYFDTNTQDVGFSVWISRTCVWPKAFPFIL